MTTVFCDGNVLLADRKLSIVLPTSRKIKMNGKPIGNLYAEECKITKVDNLKYKKYKIVAFGYAGLGSVLDKIRKHWNKERSLCSFLDIVTNNEKTGLILITDKKEVIEVKVENGKIDDELVKDRIVVIGSGKTYYDAYSKFFQLDPINLFQLAIFGDDKSSEGLADHIDLNADTMEIKPYSFKELTLKDLKGKIIKPEGL